MLSSPSNVFFETKKLKTAVDVISLLTLNPLTAGAEYIRVHFLLAH